jgi:hypothetical protein
MRLCSLGRDRGGKDGDKGMTVLLEQQRIKPAEVRLNFSLAGYEEI